MDLGRFSISLAVKDIRASREFYEKLGLEVLDDHESEGWLILRSGQAAIGLFQGMFEGNLLTFNPTDARAVQRHLKAQGVALTTEADEEGTGQAFITLTDPDGNAILIDQLDPDYQMTTTA